MIRRNSNFEARVLPDGFVLLHSSQVNWVHTLTPLGGLVWEFCDGTNSVESIVQQLAQIDTGIAQSDLNLQVVALVTELGERGLLAENP